MGTKIIPWDINIDNQWNQTKGAGPKYLIIAFLSDRLGTRLLFGKGLFVMGLEMFPELNHDAIEDRS